MDLLFVHGMGRSPLSGWPMLRYLRRTGLKTHTFGYSVCTADFLAIRQRLVSTITELSSRGPYLLVGHSLGGVLIRAAMNALPSPVPKPQHVFLLGSPIRPSCLAQRLAHNPAYRWMTGDCGQLLACADRMADIGPVAVPVTVVAGVQGMALTRPWLGDEPNDGVVALSEVSAPWLPGPIQLPLVHTVLPSSTQVARIIWQTLQTTPTHQG